MLYSGRYLGYNSNLKVIFKDYISLVKKCCLLFALHIKDRIKKLLDPIVWQILLIKSWFRKTDLGYI